MKPSPSAPDLTLCTPARARAAFRTGVMAPTSGVALGYAQANLISLPLEYAHEMWLFAQRNRQACPILEVTETGSWRSRLAPDADLRTDLPGYRVWRDGEVVEETRDVRDIWREDLVTFLIGCSFTFETLLRAAGIPLRHVEQGTNVPMFITDRQCTPAGRLSGPLVVSLRPIPEHQVNAAVQISGLMPAVHGAPVHVGSPAALGIRDLAEPDFGDPVEFADGDVPVFWACGVTSQTALAQLAPPFAITHAPGHMFITDVEDIHYRTTRSIMGTVPANVRES